MPCKLRRSGLLRLPAPHKTVFCHSAAAPCAHVSAVSTLRVALVFGTLRACAASRHAPHLHCSDPTYHTGLLHPHNCLNFGSRFCPLKCMLVPGMLPCKIAGIPWKCFCPAGPHPRIAVGCRNAQSWCQTLWLGDIYTGMWRPREGRPVCTPTVPVCREGWRGLQGHAAQSQAQQGNTTALVALRILGRAPGQLRVMPRLSERTLPRRSRGRLTPRPW